MRQKRAQLKKKSLEEEMDTVQINVQIKDMTNNKIKPTLEKITSKSLETAANRESIQLVSQTVNKLKTLTQKTAQIMETESEGRKIIDLT